MTDSNFIEQLTQKLRSVGALHAVGEQWISCDGTIPPGGVPFCGQSVSRALYADLFAWAQTQGKVKSEVEWQEIASAQDGNCIFYSDGDGSTTFRMPCISGYLRGSAGTTDAGKWIEEGLPNVTGSWPADIGNKVQPKGAIYVAKDSVSSNATAGSNGSTDSLLGVDLSRSNSIYGNSEHVTPKTNTVLVGVYAVSIISNLGSADLADIQTSIADLDVKVSNIPVSASYVTETWMAEDGNSWYRVFSDGWIEQGGFVSGVSANIVVTLPVAYSSAEYSITFGTSISTFNTASISGFLKQTAEGFRARVGSNANGAYWRTCGF